MKKTKRQISNKELLPVSSEASGGSVGDLLPDQEEMLKEMQTDKLRKQFYPITPEKIKELRSHMTKEQIELIDKFNDAETTAEVINLFRLIKKDNKEHFKNEHLKNEVNDGLLFMVFKDSVSAVTMKVILPLRERLIEELDIKTTSEKILLDAALINYNRFLSYQAWISKLLEWGVRDESSKTIERFNKMSDSSLNQFNRGLETLRTLKLTPLKVSIKNSQVNLGNNQQIMKLDDKSAV